MPFRIDEVKDVGAPRVTRDGTRRQTAALQFRARGLEISNFQGQSEAPAPGAVDAGPCGVGHAHPRAIVNHELDEPFVFKRNRQREACTVELYAVKPPPTVENRVGGFA